MSPLISELPAKFAHTDIVTVLQTAMAPAFLLVALGAMLNLFAGRLTRIIDRSRALQILFKETEGREHAQIVNELHFLQQRIKTVNSAIYLSVMGSIVVCVLIGLLFLMGMTELPFLPQIVAGAFIIAVGLLSMALVQFLREVRISIKVVMIRDEFLKHSEDEEPKQPRIKRG